MLHRETAVQQTTEDNMQLKTIEENEEYCLEQKSDHRSLDSELRWHLNSQISEVIKLVFATVSEWMIRNAFEVPHNDVKLASRFKFVIGHTITSCATRSIPTRNCSV